MTIITSALAITMLVVNIALSKMLKEALCLHLNRKREFDNLDIDLIIRGLIFLGLFGIEIGVLSLILD